MQSNFVGLKEAAQRLDISYPTILRRIKAGEIRHVKLGNRVLVPESYFRALEAEAMKEGE